MKIPLEKLPAMGYATPGTHPLTGQPFTSGALCRRGENEIVHTMPPGPPEREVVTEWDEDGDPLETRTLSDEEFAAAMRAYEQARQKWNRTLGMHVVEGRVVVEGTFTCDDGSWARGFHGDGQWHWIEMVEKRES